MYLDGVCGVLSLLMLVSMENAVQSILAQIEDRIGLGEDQ